jgi:hypothetical protein
VRRTRISLRSGGSDTSSRPANLGWRNIQSTENIGYPNQQLYRYRSLTGDPACDETSNYDGCFSRPDSVQIFDYPNTTASGEWYHSAYVNDRIAVGRRLTLNVGLRYDRYSSFLPEQGNPGTGPFATKNLFEYKGEDNYPIYSTIVPRVSATYDITGQGRFAIRGSYRRYVGGSSGASANPGPGATDVNPNAIITRTYSNWDGSIPYVPIAANLTATTGGGTNRAIDPNLDGPFVDEYTAGFDIGLSRDLTIQINYVKKTDGKGNKRINIALPYDAYTVVTPGVDPGRDNITGTADDKPIVIYSVPRTFPTFGQSIERTIQLTSDESRNKYDALGMTFNKQYSRNWSFLFSFNADHRDLRDLAPRSPNELIYGPGDNDTATGGAATNNALRHRLPEWSYSMRISGSYQLPWGLLYATSFVGQSGEWFGRDVQIRDGNATLVTVRVEPQVGRYDWVKLWDNRLSKRIKTFRTQSIEGIFDLFNTLNINTITTQTNRNGSTYLQPTEIIAARVFRLGVRYKF